MHRIILLFAIALTATSCEKDGAGQICGPIVGATRYGEHPHYNWFHVIKDANGELYESPIENYGGVALGEVICIED